MKVEAILKTLRGKEKIKRKSHFSVNKEIKKFKTIALFGERGEKDKNSTEKNQFIKT